MEPFTIFFILLFIGCVVGFFIPGEGRGIFKGWYTLVVPWEHSIADHVEFNFIQQDARGAYRNLMIANARALNRIKTAGAGEDMKKMQNAIASSIGTMNGLTKKLNKITNEDGYKKFIDDNRPHL